MKLVLPGAALTLRGYLMLLGPSLIVMLGVVSPLAYAAAALLLVLWIMCAVIEARTVLRARTFSVHRLLPPRMLQSESQRVEYLVTNNTDRPLRCTIIDEADATFAFTDDTRSAIVAPRTMVNVVATGTPTERGTLRFQRLYVRVSAGIGLVAYRYRIDASAQIKVYPNFLQTNDANSLTQRNLLLREGMRRLKMRGQQGERDGVRAYRPGDAFRSIDFKASARRGSLMVAEYGMERGEQIVLAVDCGRLMTARAGDKSMLDHAVGAALSIAAIARDAGDRIGMYAFADQPIAAIDTRSGAAQSAVLADAAARLQTSAQESDYELAAAGIVRRFRKRSLVIIFTSIIDPAASQDLLRACTELSLHHTVLCVVLNDGTLRDLAQTDPQTPEDGFRSAVAIRLLDERRAILGKLRAGGTILIDAPAAETTMPLLDAYLRIKRGSPEPVRAAKIT